MSLKIGTIEKTKTIVATKPILTPETGTFGNSGNSGGGNKNGGKHFFDDDLSETDVFKPDKYRVGMGLILLVVLMTFGCLIGAYVVIATNQPTEWKAFKLPYFQLWISTALIIGSSFLYETARRKLVAVHQKVAGKWFLATSILGVIFIASQVLVWFDLVKQGYYASGNPYAGFFYILTAIHAIHVSVGIISLTYIVLKTKTGTNDDEELLRRQWFTRVVGWYWHFMGALWLILFTLLGFYK